MWKSVVEDPASQVGILCTLELLQWNLWPSATTQVGVKLQEVQGSYGHPKMPFEG